jgi:hypothetical protein
MEMKMSEKDTLMTMNLGICLTMNVFVHSQKQFVSHYKCSTSQDEMFCGADN